MNRRIFLGSLLVSSLALRQAWGVELPEAIRSGPIRLIVPYPPGGTFDLVGRRFAVALASQLGTHVFVENIPGAGAALAVNAVASSKPDGRTLLILPNSTLTIVPQLYASPPFQPDVLDVIGLIATAQYVLVANADFEPNNLQELIALARERPDDVSFGSFGTGTASHLTGEWINQLAELDMLHVPYRGSSASLVDLMGGSISFSIDAIPATKPQIEAGNLKALAVTGPSRSEVLPDVPTVAESGFPEFQTGGWVGLAGPAGMPPELLAALRQQLAEIAGDPAMQDELRELGMEPVEGSQPDMRTLLAEETKRYQQIIQKGDIRLD